MIDLNAEGLIADIQRSSVHDGPGIRTTVFLKGCNMSCKWCHNPETIAGEPEYILYPDNCIGCKRCREGCYSGARVLCGRLLTVDHVFEEVMRDLPFYGEDGGITISGGEPTLQPHFTENLLMLAKSAGIKTAIESNLSLSWDIIDKIANCCDLIMCDLKTWDRSLHKQYTGITNENIISNIKKLDNKGISLIIRTPVIAQVNDTMEELGGILSFVAGIKSLLHYEILTYHSLGQAKGLLKNGSKTFGFETPELGKLEGMLRQFSAYQLPIKINGRAFSYG